MGSCRGYIPRKLNVWMPGCGRKMRLYDKETIVPELKHASMLLSTVPSWKHRDGYSILTAALRRSAPMLMFYPTKIHLMHILA